MSDNKKKEEKRNQQETGTTDLSIDEIIDSEDAVRSVLRYVNAVSDVLMEQYSDVRKMFTDLRIEMRNLMLEFRSTSKSMMSSFSKVLNIVQDMIGRQRLLSEIIKFILQRMEALEQRIRKIENFLENLAYPLLKIRKENAEAI
ncbi:MAG: hypothetical protein ACTSXJ_06325 [Candidatus Baldrarchaeia archaeon]